MKKKVISIILALAIAFSAAAPAFSLDTASKRSAVSQGVTSSVAENGFWIMPTSKIFKILNFFTGLFGMQSLDVTVDETITQLCSYISEQSILDVNAILTGIPDIQDPARLLSKAVPVDMANLRELIYSYKDELFESGNRLGAGICHMLGAGLSLIDSCSVYAERMPEEGENVIALKLLLTLHDGSQDLFEPPLYINLDTGLAYGRDDKGMLSLGFNFNIYDCVAYATIHSWQREKGFFFGYDLLCYILPFYNYRTRRIRFEYGDKEWMVQVWKGIYFFTTGAEVGIYSREKGSFGTYYDTITDDEMMNMSMSLKHGEETIVKFDEHMNWWVNGFKVGTRIYHPHSLDLSFSIEFYCEEMAEAFVNGAKKNIYKDLDCTLDGCRVLCKWDARW